MQSLSTETLLLNLKKQANHNNKKNEKVIKNQTQNKEKTNPKIKKKLPKQQAYPPSKIKN